MDRQHGHQRRVSQISSKRTKHVTSAERAPKAEDYPGAKPELLVPASVVSTNHASALDLRDCYNWWIYVPGANWRHPEGPQVR